MIIINDMGKKKGVEIQRLINQLWCMLIISNCQLLADAKCETNNIKSSMSVFYGCCKFDWWQAGDKNAKCYKYLMSLWCGEIISVVIFPLM